MKILSQADGECRVCVEELIELAQIDFPEFNWEELSNEIEKDED